MIESYIILAGRIRKELDDLQRLSLRANRAMEAARKEPKNLDLYIDSAALNLHDIYSGVERLLKQIAATVDGNLPSSPEWHRDLLEQMGLDIPRTRPPVLTTESIRNLDEYLRFRHVVRNVYTFTLDPERVGRLVKELGPIYDQLRSELLMFAQFLEKVGME